MTQTSSSAPTAPSPGTYRLDAEATSITFATRHLFGLSAVQGTFAVDFGEVTVADNPEESVVVVTVATSSTATGTPKRDEKVLSAQFLDAATQPTLSFRSTGLAHRDGHLVVSGDLKVKGTTGPVELMVDQVSGVGGGLQATASLRIDRYAFGVTAMKGIAGRYLDLVLDVRATLASPSQINVKASPATHGRGGARGSLQVCSLAGEFESVWAWSAWPPGSCWPP